MSIGESHEHARTPMRIWGVSGVPFRFIVHSSASGTSCASSLIQFFSIVLDVRHLPRTMVFDSVCISMGEHRERGRTS